MANDGGGAPWNDAGLVAVISASIAGVVKLLDKLDEWRRRGSDTTGAFVDRVWKDNDALRRRVSELESENDRKDTEIDRLREQIHAIESRH